MLLARVDQGTITPLKNASQLVAIQLLDQAIAGVYPVKLNWSRTPNPLIEAVYDPDAYVKTDLSIAPIYAGRYIDNDNSAIGYDPTRYQAQTMITSLAFKLGEHASLPNSKINTRIRFYA
nr:hypothetical protein [Zooshikella ganghwensis]